MKLISLDFNMKSFDDQDVIDIETQKPVHAANYLAHVISQQTKGDAVKLFGWAQQLSKKKQLLLDKSDVKTLRSLVEEAPLSVVAKANLLEAIDNASTPKESEDQAG